MDSVRYCSKRCSEKGRALALRPDTINERNLPKPVGPAWVLVWAVIAITLGIINFGLDIGSWPRGTAPKSAFSGAVGYALGPFILAALCMISKQHRSMHGFFKVAGIVGFLLMFSSLGRIPSQPRDSVSLVTSGVLTWA